MLIHIVDLLLFAVTSQSPGWSAASIFPQHSEFGAPCFQCAHPHWPLSRCRGPPRLRWSRPSSRSRGCLKEVRWSANFTEPLQQAQPSESNMMSAIETGTPVYQSAQLLNWVYMSLQESQSSAFDGFKAETDASPQDKRGAELSSNYLDNFFHLRSEVGFLS